MSGDHERAIRLLEFLHNKQHHAFWEERQASGNIWLARLYLRVGREADSKRELEAAAEKLEDRIEAGLRHPTIFFALAEVYLALGRDQEAVDMAEKHVAYGGWDPANRFDSPPRDAPPFWTNWQRLASNARFAGILDRARANREQEVQRIRAITARNDIDALLTAVPSKPEQETAEVEDAG
jgi:tetratricopeptide (TPR) repeat protein